MIEALWILQRSRLLTALLVTLLLSGCAVGPDFDTPAQSRPTAWPEFPAHVKNGDKDLPSQVQAAGAEIDWWERFQDPILNSLIRRALKENLTLQEASTLLSQSRALRVAAGADQFPMISGNASYTRLQPSQNGILNLARTLTGGPGAGDAASGAGAGNAAGGTGIGVVKFPASGIQPFNLYEYGLDASWEVDLWGRVRREMESAEASVEASRAAHQAVQLSIIAEVARSYIELRRQQANHELAKKRQATAGELLELSEHQARHGIVTDVEVEAARSALASIEAELPKIEQQIAALINQLSLLLDLQPGGLAGELGTPHPVPTIPTRVRIGLPSELARRRPDIREAEARLHAALAEIGQATAEFYPKVTLNGSAGFQSLRLKDLGNWSSLQYAAGPTVTLPLFQGGRLMATLELRQAEHQQAAVNFRETVLNAWHEVDNALSAYGESQRHLQSVTRAARSKQQSQILSAQRFAAGIINYQPVLEAEALFIQSEQNRIESQAALANQLVVLYKSLGGGWQAFQEQAVPEEEG